MAQRTVLLIALVAFLLNNTVRADDAPQLTGSTLKAEDVLAKADAVFVGKIIQMGLFEPGSTDVGLFRHVHIKVLQVLRGVMGSVTSVSFYTRGGGEEPPKVGSAYIIFAKGNVQGSHDQSSVLKFLPATNDNITLVKKLISN